MSIVEAETRGTVLAGAILGLLCATAALAVAAVWWWLGPDSVTCYYASYSPFDDSAFGDMTAKMWPTRWFWAGLAVVPVLTGALAGWIAARLGIRVSRRSRSA